MNHSGLSDSVLTRNVKSPANVSGTVVNSSGIDMQGWEGARFVINVGVLGTNGTADCSVIASINSNMSGATLVTGSALTQVVNANSVQIIDVFRPQKRYLALAAAGHTNGAVLSATVDLYRRSGILPATQVAEQHVKVVDV
jgi:hypothetical protein